MRTKTEREICGEAPWIPIHGLVQRACGNSVELREIGVQHDADATQSVDASLDGLGSVRRGNLSPIGRARQGLPTSLRFGNSVITDPP